MKGHRDDGIRVDQDKMDKVQAAILIYLRLLEHYQMRCVLDNIVIWLRKKIIGV